MTIARSQIMPTSRNRGNSFEKDAVRLLIVSAFLIAGFTVSLTSCALNDVSNAKPTPSPTLSSDQAYQASVNTLMDRLVNHLSAYNTGMERVGTQFRSAKTESEQRLALQQVIVHLENSRGRFRQDLDDFTRILPPTKFRDFHLSMTSVLRDYTEAMTAFVTYYTRNLNMGEQDVQLLNRASAQLRMANENRPRAALMYADLVAKK